MLIMDDCMSSKGDWIKNPNVLELFFNGRHHHISFILTMQYCIGIPPELRSNFDYIFLLAEDIVSNQKRLYEHYAGMFPKLEIFQQVFTNITNDYGVMVIDNKTHSSDLTDKVFWYKAKEVPKFKVGIDKYIDYHNKRYNEKWNISGCNNVICSNIIKKNKNIKIEVKKVK